MSNHDGKPFRRAPATISVHGGSPDQPHGAVVPPVFHSATYGFKSFSEFRRYARGELTGRYSYSRHGNPTVADAERTLAELKGAEDCVVTASGSAATFATLAALCEVGDRRISKLSC